MVVSAGDCVCRYGTHSTGHGSAFITTNDSARPWSKTTISSWARTYTREFAEAIIKGVEAALINGKKASENFPVESSSLAGKGIKKDKTSQVFKKVKKKMKKELKRRKLREAYQCVKNGAEIEKGARVRQRRR